MSNTKKYAFKLKPVEHIYFGKEKHPLRSNYFVESHYWPQQTGVLGLVRYLILKEKGWLDENKYMGRSLIGSKSFDGSKGQEFGIIKSISPLSIWDNGSGKNLYPIKSLNKMIVRSLSSIDVSYNHSLSSDKTSLHLIRSKSNSNDVTDLLDVKDYSNFSTKFSSFDHDISFNEYKTVEKVASNHSYGISILAKNKSNGVFIKYESDGITKSYDGSSQTQAYFLTELYQMDMQFDYYFEVEIKEEQEFEFSREYMAPFGGERALWSVKVEEVDASSNESRIEVNDNIIQLISDSVVSNNILDHVDSIIGRTIHFRNIIHKIEDSYINIYNSTTEVEDYERTDKNRVGVSLSMLEKGSLIIPKQGHMVSVLQMLETPSNYKKIGYNHFNTIKELPNV